MPSIRNQSRKILSLRNSCCKNTVAQLRFASSSSSSSDNQQSHNNEQQKSDDKTNSLDAMSQNPVFQRLARDRPLLDYKEYMSRAQGFQRFDFWRNHPMLNINPIKYPKEIQYLFPGWKWALIAISVILILEKLGLKERVLKDRVAEYHENVTLQRIPEEFREEARHLMHH